MNEQDLYALAEEFLSYEKDGVVDEAGLTAFATKTEHFTDQEHADLLNLANDIREQRKGATDEDKAAEADYNTESHPNESEAP